LAGVHLAGLVPLVSAAAIICATIAALAGDRMVAVIISAIVLVNLQFVSPWLVETGWKHTTLISTLVWFAVVAPEVAIALNIKATSNRAKQR